MLDSTKDKVKDYIRRTINEREKVNEEKLTQIHSALSVIQDTLTVVQDSINVNNDKYVELSKLCHEVKSEMYHESDLNVYHFRDGSGADLERLQMIAASNKRKILICGNYGDINFGDELMLNTVLQYVSGDDSVSVTVMTVPNRQYDVVSLKGATVIHFPSSYADIPLIAGVFDAIVFAGGAVIEDRFYHDDKFGIPLCRVFSDLASEALYLKKKVYCLGLSSTNEPLMYPAYKKKLQFIIDHADVFTLRDKYSKAFLSDNQIDTGKVQVVSDIAYANQIVNSHHAVGSTDVKKIGIILLCYEKPVTLLTRLINDAHSKYGRDVDISFIPFYEGKERDYQFYQEFVRNASNEHLKVYPFTNDVDTVCAEMCEQDVIVSSRYHGSLMAMMMNIPCITVLKDNHPHYENKIRYLMEQFGKTIDDCYPESELLDIGHENLFDRIVTADDSYRTALKDAAENEMEKVMAGVKEY